MNKNTKSRIKIAHDLFVKGGRQAAGVCGNQQVGKAVPYAPGRRPKVYSK